MLDCVLGQWAGIVHKSADDSYGVRDVRPYRDHPVHKGANFRCIRYRLHIFPLQTGCRAISLRHPKVNGEWGQSRFGRLHVEVFQDTSDVVGLRQEKLSFIAMPTNLHSEYVSCRTEVLHGKLQPQFPNEFGEFTDMSTTGEKISSFSPLVKRFRRSRRHILVEIPSQLIWHCTLGWSNRTSLLGIDPFALKSMSILR